MSFVISFCCTGVCGARGEFWGLGLIPVPCGTEGLVVPGAGSALQAGSGAGFIFTQHKHSMSELFPLFTASTTA